MPNFSNTFAERGGISEIHGLKRVFWKMVPGGYFKQIWKLCEKVGRKVVFLVEQAKMPIEKGGERLGHEKPWRMFKKPATSFYNLVKTSSMSC